MNFTLILFTLKGLLKHKDLVEELRTRHTHEQDQQQKSVKESDFKVVIGPQDSLDKGIETVSAAYLGKMFDYYTKELVRLREERRLSAMVLKAERARKEKESLERGKPLVSSGEIDFRKKNARDNCAPSGRKGVL